MSDSISTRCAKLNQVFSGKNVAKKFSRCFTREALVDAFLALFDQCNEENLLKDKNIASFVEKYKPMCADLRRLCLSKDDFEVVDTIGRGHFGEVQVVRDKQSKDVYAMKTLRKSKQLAQENVAFYEEEREIMAVANNPWITALQYAFQDARNLYLVMEYHPGGDLLSLLNKYDDVLEEDMARFYLAELVLAIQSLHMLGYVHRDVKPDNVLIDRTGHIKLADFGSSARSSADDKKVYSKMPVGTPEYIAPEVLTSMDGLGGRYGAECDWWSLGVVAYEMLYGQTPFEADSMVITYSKIMDYKNSLRFPEEFQVSENAKNLIRNLCTESESRLGYESLSCHQFFNGIAWNNLQETVPPYVPNLESAEDTSNFDEFEPESPDTAEYIEKNRTEEKAFSGKDLPFVGFTFFKTLSLPPSPRKACLPTSPIAAVSSSSIQRRLTMKTQELKDALQSCDGLKNEKSNMQKMLEDLQAALEQKEKALTKAEIERDLLEKEKVLYDTQIKDLQRRLDSERTERQKSDSATLKLLGELKETSCKADELRDQERRASVDEHQQIISQLEQERFIANKRAQRMETELSTKEKFIEENKVRTAEMQGRLSRMNEEAKRNMEEWQEKLDKVTADSDARISELQNKLSKSLQANQEATDLLENVRKSKDELHKTLLELKGKSGKTGESNVKPRSTPLYTTESDSVARGVIDEEDLAQRIVERIWEEAREEGSSLRERYREKCTELRKLQTKVMDIEDQLFKAQRSQKKMEREATSHQKQSDKLMKAEKEVELLSKYKRQSENTNKKLQEELDAKKKLLKYNEETTEAWKLKYKALEELLKERPGENKDTYTDEEDGRRFNMQEKALLAHLQQDKRSMEQKIASLQDELEEWQENNRSLKENLSQREEKLTEMSNDFASKTKVLEEELNKAQSELSALRSTNKALGETILKLENEIDTKLLEEEIKLSAKRDALDKQIRDGRLVTAGEVQTQLNEMVERRKELSSQNKEYEAKLEKATEQCSELMTTKENLEDALKEKERTLESQALTISMLKSTCTMLENQVEELETMNEDNEEKIMQLEINRKKTETTLEKLECSAADARRSVEQEKSAKTLSEEKNAKLQEALQDVQNAHIKEVDEITEQLTRQRERNEELAEMLNETEKKLGLTNLEMKTLERKLTEDKNKSEDERKKLQIEVNRLSNSISTLKAANFELNQNIEQFIEKIEELSGREVALAEQLELMEASHAEERLKLEATSSQQTKLIDFLQHKSEGQTPKKKKLIGGGKSWRKQPEENKKTLHQQWKDLQQALEKERASSLHLQTELNRTTAELQAAKMEVAHWKAQSHNAATPKPAQTYAVLSALQQSPSNQPGPLGTLNLNQCNTPAKPASSDPSTHRPQERMHHNIPHRFINVLNMRATKCAVCMNTVHFGRQSSKCADCSSICHVKCAPNLAHTCGLPDELVEHFSDALQEQKTDASQKLSRNNTSRLPGGKLEGWLKVPRFGSVKQGWEKRWLVLDDQTLQLFDQEDARGSSSPSETLNLCGKDGPVTVHSAAMCSELIGTAATDLPYVLRVESRPRCWPTQNLYLLAPDFREKQRWVTSLEAVLGDIRKRNTSESESDQKLLGNVLMQVEGSDHIDINSTKLLNDDLVILVAEEGLFSLSLGASSTPRKLPGIDKAVQMDTIPELGLAILITGKERQLCTMDLKQLQARARQNNSTVPLTPLASQVIEKIKNCHLFAVGQSDGKYFICAATPNKLLLLRFNSGMSSFCLRKEVDVTTDPCNCIYFTPSCVIYGTDRFYTLDLKQHTVKGFLDPNDTSLAFALYGAQQMEIFPVLVLDVTSSGCIKKEYLLCYNELGVFVDSCGRQTRNQQLPWTRLSLDFAYSEPFLYVTHYNSISVCEIPALTSSKPTRFSHKFMEIRNPRILGPAVSPGAIYLVSTLHEQVQMLCFQGSSAASIAGSASDDDADADEDDIFSRLSMSVGPAEFPTKLVRSPTWSPGSDKENMAGKVRTSSFRSGKPFKSLNKSTENQKLR